MKTNSSGTNLVIGLAAFGLALVIGGVQLVRRRQAWETASTHEDAGKEAEAGTNLEAQIPAQGPHGGESGPSERTGAPQEKLPLDFFVLVVVLTIPFWLFGEKPIPIPIKLPWSALALVSPMIAAIILTYRRNGSKGIKELFKRAVDAPKIKNKAWYLPILFLMPVIMAVSYAVMRLAGLPLPDPQIPWLLAPAILLGFFVAGIGEELGWMGYAYDPMQNRWGALKASILLGLFWALFHLIPDLQNRQAADWILWHRLNTIAGRILMVWIYNNNGKSVFSAILFHAADNLGWALFPNYGSHYNPFITFIVTLPVLGMVLLGWDWKTLARSRFARPRRAEARKK